MLEEDGSLGEAEGEAAGGDCRGEKEDRGGGAAVGRSEECAETG